MILTQEKALRWMRACGTADGMDGYTWAEEESGWTRSARFASGCTARSGRTGICFPRFARWENFGIEVRSHRAEQTSCKERRFSRILNTPSYGGIALALSKSGDGRLDLVLLKSQRV